ncbi:MAG: hypothetical protein AAFO91_01440, partial [Bacteroidota bacterium]
MWADETPEPIEPIAEEATEEVREEVTEEVNEEPEDLEISSEDSDVNEDQADESTESNGGAEEVVEVLHDQGLEEVVDIEGESEESEYESIATSSDPVIEVIPEESSVNDDAVGSSTPSEMASSSDTDAEETEEQTSNNASSSTEGFDAVEKESDSSRDSGDTGVSDEVVSSSDADSATEYASSSEGLVLGTSTEPVISESTEAHVVHNAAEKSFDSDNCVSVARGSYYCSDEINESLAEVENQLFAQPDADGDMEIYLRAGGELTQITENVVDDRAPYYDPESNSLVWHRMINDRYQIVSYDIETGIESMLTDSPTNNMEPTRVGDTTVWQRWIANNWEIMLYSEEELTQLTSNEVHDVAPKIRDGHILWQTIGNSGSKQVTVYELDSGRMNTIVDVDGGAIKNPRLVLLYETIYDNGDTVTRGYDFESGEVIPLAAMPAEVPDSIPESDSTGETRALIQQKTQMRAESASNTASSSAVAGVATTSRA